MRTFLRNIANDVFNKIGYTLTKYSPYQEYNMLMNHYGITRVLDIGANKGQFASFIKKTGFKGEIHSFEPLDEAFATLEKLSTNNKNWKIYQCALGDECTTAEINVSENLVSSSILDMKSSHLELAPQSRYTKKQKIEVKTLDSLAETLKLNEGETYMKVDTQGFEKKVLLGADKILSKINTIQLELSLVPLYDGEELFYEISEYLYSKGFVLVKLIPGIYDKKTRETLQFDGIFHRIKK